MDEGRTSTYAASFVERYTNSFPPSAQFFTDPNGSFITGHTDDKFRQNRENCMWLYMGGEPKYETIYGHFVEPLVELSLRPYLRTMGFDVVFAPQSEEHGRGQQGIDLFITDSDGLVYLGMDVKGRRKMNDRYGWSPHLRSPFIFLSVGNWTVDMREAPNIPTRTWTKDFVVPSLQQTGQIPELNNFARFVANRGGRTVETFSRNRDYVNRYHRGVIPQNDEERTILDEKLDIVNDVFTELRLAI